MFYNEDKKKYDIYPCKPQFYYIKGWIKEVKIIRTCFRDAAYWNTVPSFPRKQILPIQAFTLSNQNLIGRSLDTKKYLYINK